MFTSEHCHRTQLQAMAAQLAQRNDKYAAYSQWVYALLLTIQSASVNDSKPPVASQDKKIKVNTSQVCPETNLTDLFTQRSQFIQLTFPNANNKVELLKDHNSAVKFWTRDDWNEWNNKQPRSKGRDRRVSNAVPRHYYYLEDEHGELVSIVVYNNILKYMRETFADTNHYMPALLGPSWSRVDKVFQEAIKNEMSTRFPLFTLCQGGWKVHDILSRWYSHWRGKPGAKLKKAKKGSEVGDGDDGEDSEGQETHGHRPSPDETIATASTNPGSSNIGADSADTSASKKRPHHESEAPAPVKKPKVIKNPM